MAIWNEHWFSKLPEAQVPDPDGDPDTKWVDFAKVYDFLVGEGKVYAGSIADLEVSDPGFRAYFWCSDRHDANVIKAPGHGWYALPKGKARNLAESLDID